jgi:hypothetical protein
MTEAEQLLARHRKGERLTWEEMQRACPHRVVLNLDGPVMLDDSVEVSAMIAVIGNCPAAFSDRMREQVVEALRDGLVVLVLANSVELLHHAIAVIELELAPPRGNA